MKTAVSLLLACLFCLFLSAPLGSTEPYPDMGQALVRMLWGSRGLDVWSHTFTGAGDTVSVAFAFYNPDSTDTLDLAPSAVIFSPDVTCTVYSYGDSLIYIDRDDPSIVKGGESLTLAAQIKWIHVISSAAGLVRAWALAD